VTYWIQPSSHCAGKMLRAPVACLAFVLRTFTPPWEMSCACRRYPTDRSYARAYPQKRSSSAGGLTTSAVWKDLVLASTLSWLCRPLDGHSG
jgi:hypothetical protein